MFDFVSDKREEMHNQAHMVRHVQGLARCGMSVWSNAITQVTLQPRLGLGPDSVSHTSHKACLGAGFGHVQDKRAGPHNQTYHTRVQALATGMSVESHRVTLYHTTTQDCNYDDVVDEALVCGYKGLRANMTSS